MDEGQNPHLTCAICLDIFHVPATTPCGHTFCDKCIGRHWDTQSQADLRCPICSEVFCPRPLLKRNVSLNILAEAARGGGAPRGDHSGGAAQGQCNLHKKPLVYYCKRDKQAVCCECGVSRCNTHEKVLLEKERETQELLLKRKSEEVEKLLEETDRSIGQLTENIDEAKVTLEQTSRWCDNKFSTLMEALTEKHEATNRFEPQNVGALAEAEARLTQLNERAQQLRESRQHIQELHTLPDVQLIQVRASTLRSSFAHVCSAQSL
ncbi:hypothetical protein NHX12_025130 [Muraenolepis orangiensis]|uniref:RING-type domain-containing protein n=1 Tax=Muraenolepis orangiensis TaxID=630683 RepID=A0A9Q0IRY8_9TELE|nr:hypothetical protein NHX12_025130 [Muraenolepis orangiensis]